MSSLKRDYSSQRCIVDEEEIAKTKSLLWKSLTTSNDVSSISKEEKDLKDRLDSAFKQKVSTSILLIGPPGCGKRKLVDKVLTSYNPYNAEGGDYIEPSIARVNGNICNHDSQALNSLADQLLIRSSTEDRHFNLAVEDLEKHFQRCRLDNRPAIVILEEIDLFARREKQILIYTLLDLMHKEKLLFVVIGISSCGALHLILEKRILSRLNAQYVHIPPLKDSDICKTLAKRLTKPFIDRENDSKSKKRKIKSPINEDENDGENNKDDNSKDDKTGHSNEKAAIHSTAEYHSTFMIKIYELFGDWENEDIATRKKGELEDIVSIYVNWGRSLDFFIKIAMRAVQRLSVNRPYFDKRIIEAEVAAMDPVTTAEMINWLPQLELYILGAIYRLEVTRTANADITVGNALLELNKIVSKDNLPTRNKIVEGFLSLADLKLISISNGMSKVTTSRRITDQTFVHLVNPKHEYENAFGTKITYSSGTNDSLNLNLGRRQPVIKMNEKLRSSILVPRQQQIGGLSI